MFLVAGLGNPGEKYHHTRHNIGFLFVDHFASKLGVDFSATKWKATAVKVLVENEPVLLFKPQTFMNLSGVAVSAAAAYYKVPPEKIIVIHDDLDLSVGRTKIVVDRGAGGHNGIRSIIAHLSHKNFIRFKVGIGRPETPVPVERYVLTRFDNEEMGLIDDMLDSGFDAIRLIIKEGVVKAMNKINCRKK